MLRFWTSLIALFLLSSMWAQSAVISWTGPNSSINIADKVSLYADAWNTITIEEISSPAFEDRFEPSHKNVLNFTNDAYYWLRFSWDNRTNDQLILALDQPILSRVDFYFWDTLSKSWHIEHAGFKTPIQDKRFKHPFQAFSLPAKSGIGYLKFHTVGLSVPIRIWDEDHYEWQLNNHRLFFGIFSGLMLFVIIINVFLFISLRRFAYLHYAVLVTLYYLTSANLEGFILYLFPNSDLVYWLNGYSIYNIPIGVSYVLIFLEAKKYAPIINKIGWVLFFWFCAYIFWHHALTPLQIHYVTHFFGLTTVFIWIVTGIQTGRGGNRMGYYIFAAYLLFFLIAIVDTINRFTGTPPLLFEISFISYGFLVEAFALSYLLTKRFEWEKRATELEKERTNALLLEQTQENERIVKEQNVVLEKKVKERTKELSLEKKKSDDLLLNILPLEVAEEIKATGRFRARNYASVSVLFTDIVGFTLLSETEESENIVEKLDYCFREFDRIVKKNNLEKIKTIGDAYMCAGGLPTVNSTNAVDIVQAGLDMCAFMKQFKEEQVKKGDAYFEVRVGINSGPVVAGVVGSDKFAYDIWGDTVNTAARMEQNSESFKVNISGATYDLIKHAFITQYRGKLEAKNKGFIDMYFVEGPIE